ncbi:GNAT family N-acetyltransferase [Kushneria aurantia]|uniref:GNAT family N-acetyltransferase n=1 Tax=Kushneria aurantia TaxID=504092 RepID=A0ABV6G5K3_9GAMM|nr:GNAT family N-acetyltransferase [Kushneria aurantia]
MNPDATAPHVEPVTDPAAAARLDHALRGHDGGSAAQFAAAAEDPGRGLWGICEHGELIAFILWAQGPFDIELEMVGVAPARRRSGLAGVLIETMLATGRAAQMERALLEVRAGNAAAIALYRRHGFAVDGHRRGYYPAPTGELVREDAVLMSRML